MRKMKLFHPRYSGADVGVGGKQYPVERAGNGGAYVNVPDPVAHLLLEHGFRKVDAVDIDSLAREAGRTRAAEEGAKRGSTKTRESASN